MQNDSPNAHSPWEKFAPDLPEILEQECVATARQKLAALDKSLALARKTLACLRMERFFAECPWASASFACERLDDPMGGFYSVRLACYAHSNGAAPKPPSISGNDLGEALAREIRALGDFRDELDERSFETAKDFSTALLGERDYGLWMARRESARIGEHVANPARPASHPPRV
jgi:hypothetical protein